MFRHQRPARTYFGQRKSLIHKSSQHINVSSINKRSPIPDNVTEVTFLLSCRRFDDMVKQEKIQTLFLSARRVHATGEILQSLPFIPARREIWFWCGCRWWSEESVVGVIWVSRRGLQSAGTCWASGPSPLWAHSWRRSDRCSFWGEKLMSPYLQCDVGSFHVAGKG